MGELEFIVGIIGSFAAVVAAIFSFILWRIRRNEDLSRLIALFVHLKFIEESAKGHESHVKNHSLNKNFPLPSWPIANMDLNFYLTHINHKIRKKDSFFCYETTKYLKQDLIKVHEKIKNINFLWQQTLERQIPNDLHTNTYYLDLYTKLHR